MKDRIPANPGRVLITPESGGAPYYATVTRADNPTQNGDPINKNTLLKDATAAMFGMGSGAVPDGVLQYIGKYAQHWWKRKALKTITQYREKKTELGNSGYYARIYKTSKASKSIVVDPNTGEITLGEPINLSNVDTYRGTYVVGKVMLPFSTSDSWRDDTATDTTTVYYLSTSASIGAATAEYAAFHYSYISVVTAEAYQLDVGGTDFVQSPNPEAYPHSGSDGSFEYTYLGQPWENSVAPAKITTGSYTGTGTRLTSSSPQTLTFDFPPAVLIIVQATSDRIYGVGMENKGTDVIFLCSAVRAFKGEAWCPYNLSTQSNSDYMLYVKTVGNSVSFYPDYSNTADFNDSGRVFHYFTIG